ncbi:hypothetical protein GDN83_00465 [Gordonia jinghuaiqii]|nr:hypothetical protein [Gordonia jinghuaiqii]
MVRSATDVRDALLVDGTPNPVGHEHAPVRGAVPQFRAILRCTSIRVSAAAAPEVNRSAPRRPTECGGD